MNGGATGRARRELLSAKERLYRVAALDAEDLRVLLSDLDDAIARGIAAEVSRDAARERALAAEQALTSMGHRERATAAERDFYQAKLQAVRVDAERLRAREDFFARALGVADRGRYRNDWPGAIERLIRERDALHQQVTGLLVASEAANAPPRQWRQCGRCGCFFWLADTEALPLHGGIGAAGAAWTCGVETNEGSGR